MTSASRVMVILLLFGIESRGKRVTGYELRVTCCGLLMTKKQNWNPPRPNGLAGRAEMEEIEMLCMYLAEMLTLANPLNS